MAENSMNEVERRLDELLKVIGPQIEAEDQQTQIINLQRVKQLEFALEALKILLEQQDVEITHKLNQPFKSMGSVSIEGKSIAFLSPAWFNRVAEVADNIEVYPLTNGKLRMTFTFHGLTTAL